MAKISVIKQNAYSPAGDQQVISPIPRRIFPAAAAIPLWLTHALSAAPSFPEAADELHIFLRKGSDEIPDQSDLTAAPPFYYGSPPTRTRNPVVHDARFREAAAAVRPVAAPDGYAGERYGLAPAAVRVVGFDCLDSGRGRSRSVPAFA